MATKSSSKLQPYLQGLSQKNQELASRLSDPAVIADTKLFRTLSREFSSLKPIVEASQRLDQILEELQAAREILEGTDPELAELAREEQDRLEQTLETLEEEIQVLLVSDRVEDQRNVFLEIRAGAGGHEASLFAQDLLRMYQRIAERRGWKSEVISTTESAIGGIKEIILHTRGQEVNRFLRFESGVHRVQRVPVTEASGRIHTSTVTVAVLPEVDDVEVTIDPKDLRIDTFRASGAGGQHVNRTESAIRITHLPTGLVVSCQDEKSQHKNRDRAMKVLVSRLYEHEQERRDEGISSARRSQVGSGERSEKIRTYNFPQSRVTDHRIQGRNFNIDQILDGNLDDMLNTLIEQDARTKLEARFQELTTP